MDIIKSIAVRCLDEGSSTAENRGDFMTVSRPPLPLGLSLFAFAGGASAPEAGIELASPAHGAAIVFTARKCAEIGRELGRENGCKSVYTLWGAVYIKTTQQKDYL